jgi:hypothetical protein
MIPGPRPRARRPRAPESTAAPSRGPVINFDCMLPRARGPSTTRRAPCKHTLGAASEVGLDPAWLGPPFRVVSVQIIRVMWRLGSFSISGCIYASLLGVGFHYVQSPLDQRY